jgi:hypothetical protein
MARTVPAKKLPVDCSAELTPYFNAVHNKDNWKLPIKASVNARDLAKTIRAITYFTGGKTTVTPIGRNQFDLESPGYYAVCGA